jgi:hypothetical protein
MPGVNAERTGGVRAAFLRSPHRRDGIDLSPKQSRLCAAERPPKGGPSFSFDNKFLLHNIPGNCYMNADSIARFVGTLLDLIDDFVSEFRTRMIASHLIRSVAVTAARYRADQRIRYPARVAAKMCLVLEEAEQSSVWLERVERRLSRRLEPVRQALFVADEIIEKTFSTRRTVQTLPRYATLPIATAKSSRS